MITDVVAFVREWAVCHWFSLPKGRIVHCRMDRVNGYLSRLALFRRFGIRVRQPGRDRHSEAGCHLAHVLGLFGRDDPGSPLLADRRYVGGRHAGDVAVAFEKHLPSAPGTALGCLAVIGFAEILTLHVRAKGLVVRGSSMGTGEIGGDPASGPDHLAGVAMPLIACTASPVIWSRSQVRAPGPAGS